MPATSDVRTPYAAPAAAVKGEVRAAGAGAPLAVPLRAACEAVGLPLAALADLAFGAACRRRPGKKTGLTRSALEVLGALLEHANTGHDRVWPCIKTLAARLDLSDDTVNAALLLWRRLGVLRVVTGEELASGPGPHTARARGVRPRSRRHSLCYDLRGLLAYVPDAVRELLLLRGQPRPAASAAPSPLPLERRDRTLPPPQAVSGVGVAVREERRKAPERKRPPGRGDFPAEKNRDGRENQGALAALRGVGLRGRVPGEMLATMGARWCRELAAYHAWLNRPGEEARGPGYLVQVWRAWQAGDGDWPEAFARRLSREKAHAARVVTAKGTGSEPPRPPVVRRPPPPSPAVAGAEEALARARARLAGLPGWRRGL